ncbi:hypothetical protein F2Q70_00043172 [Brassica cretica]|uniref:Uncharacterized protein n=1 Tax=Brassica cretica TaxID=69181 RepID=A0A8S9KDK8_BRACR|nr:hypothetical protein F2Q70_00043172 [Brassica cretica]
MTSRKRSSKKRLPLNHLLAILVPMRRLFPIRNSRSLQKFLGVLILSYELGMDLSPDDFEGLRST